jgi:excinuclease ABC subunit B
MRDRTNPYPITHPTGSDIAHPTRERFRRTTPLPFRDDSLHIPAMARSPKKSPAPDGFAEAPQSGFEGAPLEGSVADWVKQLEADAEASGVETQRQIASKAGKHRKKVEIAASKAADPRAAPRWAAARPIRRPAPPPASTRSPAWTRRWRTPRLKAGTAVTATVEALSALIESGNPLFKDGKMWTPHRPARPEKSEGGIEIRMVSDYRARRRPADRHQGPRRRPRQRRPQPGAARRHRLRQDLHHGQGDRGDAAPGRDPGAEQDAGRAALFRVQELLPRTTRSNISSPTTTITSRKPMCRAPTPSSRRNRRSTSRSTACATRPPARCSSATTVIIVASVSCIYGIGSVETYTAMTFQMTVGDRLDQRQLLADLVAQQYKRQDINFVRGSFRVRGDTIEIFPAHLEDARLAHLDVRRRDRQITEFDPLTGQKTGDLKSVKIYANSHYVTPRPTLNGAIKSIKEELRTAWPSWKRPAACLEAQRLEQRTRFDLEMLEATGSCAGIENYSRYLTGRTAGEPPPTLFEYIPDNALLFIDESHVTVPQIGGMYRGDFRRKATLAEYGFRLPSCMDNRPLRFEEWDAMRPDTVAVSATPGGWEMEQSGGVFAEQVIRPTGLIDPPVEVRSGPQPGRRRARRNPRDRRQGATARWCTVLTKRMAEDLTEYLHEQGVRVRYMHSDIDTLERIEIIRDLRLGAFDVLVGINLLREGLDIPECGFVAILDADKEGFLRSETSLIQTIGRAARNVDGKVILYADQITGSMEAGDGGNQPPPRKAGGLQHRHGITPESVKARSPTFSTASTRSDHVRADISGVHRKGFADGGHDGQQPAGPSQRAGKIRCATPPPTSTSKRPPACATKSNASRPPNSPSWTTRWPGRNPRRWKASSGTPRRRRSHSTRAQPRRTPSPQDRSGGSTPGWRGESRECTKPLFQKPTLDDMGPGTDTSVPARTFRKNDLDEMTVGRTEKPVTGHDANYRDCAKSIQNCKWR